MTPAQLETIRAANRKIRRAFALPVDNPQPEPDDSYFMAVVAAVAADPATLTYDELVAAAVAADDIAAYGLMESVMVVMA